MKKKVCLSMFWVLFAMFCSGQTVINPYYEERDSKDIQIYKIETTATATVVSGAYKSFYKDGWVNIGYNTVLIDCRIGKKYPIFKAEGICLAPDKRNMKKGEVVKFTWYFRSLPESVESVNLVEDEYNDDAFNFWMIDLTGTKKRKKNMEDFTQEVEKEAEFPGGTKALMKFVSENIIYPIEAQLNGIEGQVEVQFVVNRDGSIIEARVIKSVHPLLDAEALRVVNLMPKWKSGEKEGKPVRVRYTLPITFKFPTDD